MAAKRHKAEEIVTKLSQVDVLNAQGKSMAEGDPLDVALAKPCSKNKGRPLGSSSRSIPEGMVSGFGQPSVPHYDLHQEARNQNGTAKDAAPAFPSEAEMNVLGGIHAV